ncbi:MmgE/PrpD family protein [Achromobacter xylosoxidans]|uniref:MmgE/PrpD family protein n=1 Tax=Alcaligenes xylosoxydans xylosoxydans TaxID=85698 RepID=A0A9X3R775_ALCXX|nr:MmgE/PrpD family protein [Achromobacter xylosoxidans]MCZ8405361.1 MmgE/PrpD family protein [Achromobacter xylosoxidans]
MTTEATNITLALARYAVELDLAAAPPAMAMRVKLAILDWFAVTLVGAEEPFIRQLTAYRVFEGGQPQCGLVGRDERLAASAAALVNGTASHAIDYDDVSFSIPGHATGPVLAAALAVAEQTRTGGFALMQAVLAGYETACRIGQLVAPNHYARGFHATATLGCFGAAAAAARLLNLDVSTTAQALGIAAIKAAGLKAAFGSSCKPLQVGEAARSGLEAARLAEAGFDAPADMIGHRLGFARTHSDDFHLEAALGPPRYVPDFSVATTDPAPFDFHMETNLFKFHAACYETHAAIESALALARSDGFSHRDVVAITIHVNPHCDDICNIHTPTTPLQAKFSLRHTVALALAGRDTSSPAAFTSDNLACPTLMRLQALAKVVLDPTLRVPQTRVCVRLNDGRELARHHDSSLPHADVNDLQMRLVHKFRALTQGRLPAGQAAALEASILDLASLGGVSALLQR